MAAKQVSLFVISVLLAPSLQRGLPTNDVGYLDNPYDNQLIHPEEMQSSAELPEPMPAQKQPDSAELTTFTPTKHLLPYWHVGAEREEFPPPEPSEQKGPVVSILRASSEKTGAEDEKREELIVELPLPIIAELLISATANDPNDFEPLSAPILGADLAPQIVLPSTFYLE